MKNILAAQILLFYSRIPKIEIDPQKFLHETFYENPETNSSMMLLREKFKELKDQLPIKTRLYPRVSFLGTASPPSNTIRGNSAILVQTK